MELDQKLADWLVMQSSGPHQMEVYRATTQNADPLAASVNGGRWAPRPNDEPGFPVLYTSLDKDGAMSEVVSYFLLLNPLPSKPIRLHKLAVTVSNTVRMSMDDLLQLGVDEELYGNRNYSMTQEIGHAVNYMGHDGLISPSARWSCENLTIFIDNHGLEERLDVISSEEVEWRQWAIRQKLLKS